MLRFGPFQLDTSQKRLFEKGIELPIEPKLFDLLMLLITHTHQLVSREFIVESLWSGRYVTDNAINKQIANLRKLLNDDPKQSKYIQTVPKLGYRFICDVSEVNNKSRNNDKAASFSYKYVGLVFLGIFSVWLTTNLVIGHKTQVAELRQTTEVTRLNGIEWSPVISLDNTTMFFLHQQAVDSSNELWHKDLITNQLNKVKTTKTIGQLLQLIEDKDAPETFHIYYRQFGGESCGIYQGKTDKQQLHSTETALVSCNEQEIIDAVVDPNRKFIIYSARSIFNQAGQLYYLDLTTNSTSVLKQPVPAGNGIVSLDLASDGKSLLMMQSNNNRHSDLYTLALDTNTLTLQMSFDYYMAKASFDHDATGVYFFAPLPSNHIKHQPFGSKQISTVVSASDYLTRDIKLGPDNTLYFATRNRNFDNVLLDNNQKLKLNNSSVYDIVPTLLHQQNKYLYVSKRTGQCQIYLADLDTGDSKILSNFSNYLVIRHLQISPDDKSLLFADHNNVWRINLSTQASASIPFSLNNAELVHKSNDIVINLEWLNESHYVISTLNKEKRNVLHSVLDAQTTVLPSTWRHYITDDQDNRQLLVIDAETGNAYFTQTQLITSGASLEPEHLQKVAINLPNKLLHPKLIGNKLNFVTHESGQTIFNQRSLDDNNDKMNKSLNGYYTYDANHKMVVISDLHSISGDIHKASLSLD
ncbi:winged helix-turn-helix domain-containing protein [Thalassotalea marina]|uniref:OmpR/PhoB-type domain-containing protein n=1 Tax=Thalassotalea marina TaxID=1673741 RepID=A0A919BGA4_9GAMM|nr:winged helix-turn-helix domain-containing protein [Thalassotalea marina]GHF87605.1 hypothetical protein GCM10017161_14040 [Thalassotalea marina]